MMKMKTLLPLFFGIVILLASCTTGEAPKSINLEELKAEIQKMEDAYGAAEKAKDADGVVAYYSEDAITYNRNEEPASGMAAIKERIAQRLANDTTGNYNVYKVVDIFAEGNMVVEIGSWTSLDPSGAKMQRGHYMSYFENRDGKYLLCS